MRQGFNRLLAGDLKIANIGVLEFAESVEQQKAEVIHIDWTPPAGGDAEMLEMLDRLL